MSEVVYRVVEHDGGWAYQSGGAFSETFPTRAQAEAAATAVAAEQRIPGDTEAIEWQDETGEWHEERERGDDRPSTFVERAVPQIRPGLSERGGQFSLPTLVLIAGLAGLALALAMRGRARA